MTWAKFDDGYDEETEGLSDRAFRLFTCSITYSRRRQLGGVLDPGSIDSLFRRLKASTRHAQELCQGEDAPWGIDGDNFVIRNYEKYNPLTSTERVKKHRAEKRGRNAVELNETPDETGTQPNGTALVRAPATGLENTRKNGFVPVPVPVSLVSPSANELCDQLLGALGESRVRAKITQEWRLDADRLLRLDKRPLSEAVLLIGWATQHHFWRGVILSMPKFREKYDQLRLQWERESTGIGRESAAELSARRLLVEAQN